LTKCAHLKQNQTKCIGDFIMGVQKCLCMELLKPKGDSTRISQPHDQIEHFDTTYSWCKVSNEFQL
jgi:hypothetical protein